MKMTPKFKKTLLWSLPILSGVALATGVAIPLVIHNESTNTLKTNFTNQGFTSTVANNDASKYINHNEVSLMFSSTTKKSYVKDLITNLLKQNPQLKSFIQTVNDVEFFNVTSGTGWMLDYSVDAKNSDLVNYYLASNVHVLQPSYEVSLKNNNGQELKLSIPVNKTTTDGIDVYISQPQGNQNDVNDNTAIDSVTNYMPLWDIGWHKLANFEIIPIGGLNTKNAENSYKANFEFIDHGQQFFGAIKNDFSIISQDEIFQESTNENKPLARDFGVLKTQIDITKPIMPKAFEDDGKNSWFKFDDSVSNATIRTQGDYYNDKQNQLKTEFVNLNKMFDTKQSLNNVNKDSSYITKLRYLNQQISKNQINESELKTLFPFAKFDDAQYLNIGGFPSKASSTGGLANKFNVGNVQKNEISGPINISKYLLPFYQNGQLRYGVYDSIYNYYVNLQQLTSGASGSMVLNQNNQIVGIMWGSSGYTYNIVTPLFNNPESNLIYNFLNYQKVNDKNSQLLKLFTGLYNFKSHTNNNQDDSITQLPNNDSNPFYQAVSGDYYMSQWLI